VGIYSLRDTSRSCLGEPREPGRGGGLRFGM